MEEQPLAGGHWNRVVRIGDTVRRPAGKWTPTVHRLLAHARTRGVNWVPEPRGYDELGREVLSFIPGEVPHDLPEWLWSTSVLSSVGRALREWHDATADFDVTGAAWNAEGHEPHEVICHNDFAPYNCVFAEHRWVGAIDFDLCSPGSRQWDLAYTAYRFVPLMPGPEAEPGGLTDGWSPFTLGEMRGRLKFLIDAYAGDSPHLRYGYDEMIGAAVHRIRAVARWIEHHVATTGQNELAQNVRMYRDHASWLATLHLR